jgi:hypothetical protein
MILDNEPSGFRDDDEGAAPLPAVSSRGMTTRARRHGMP